MDTAAIVAADGRRLLTDQNPPDPLILRTRATAAARRGTVASNSLFDPNDVPHFALRDSRERDP
jgi:hypothetical protein